MKKDLLFKTAKLLTILILASCVDAYAQSVGIGHGTENLWSSIGSSGSVNDAENKIKITVSSVKTGSTNRVCDVLAHFMEIGSSNWVQIDIPDHATKNYTIHIQGTHNSTGTTGNGAGVVYLDEVSNLGTNDVGLIGHAIGAYTAQDNEKFIGYDKACNTLTITPPSGTKSVRIYRRVRYWSEYKMINTNSSVSGYGNDTRVEIGDNQTLRVSSVIVTASSSSITAPTIQASNISFSNVASNSLTINWANGDGANRAVFVKEGSGTIENPVDGTSYTASANWNSGSPSGTQLGSSGYYCVYNGTGSTVDLTNLNPSSGYTVQIFEYNGENDETIYLTGTADNNPTVQVTGTLPVSLISFSAKSDYNSVKLSWSTASEKNTDKFIVERFLAEGKVQEVATVKATGSSSTSQNYTATDKNVITGETYYYRLKTLDTDGEISYSDVESIQFNINSVDKLRVYPNPVADKLTAKLQKTAKGSTITIIDLTGEVAYKQTITEDIEEITAELSHLSPGIYILQVNNSGLISTGKFLKQ